MPSCAHIYSKIGLRGFYKGASSIYALVGAITAVEFFTFETCCDFFTRMGWVEKSGDRNTTNLVASGFITGVVAAFIYTPIEYTKIQCQINTKDSQGSLSKMIQLITQ